MLCDVDIFVLCFIIKVIFELLISVSKFKFVIMVMVGINYLDKMYLDSVGIMYSSVVGCNVVVVVEYVLSVLLYV